MVIFSPVIGLAVVAGANYSGISREEFDKMVKKIKEDNEKKNNELNEEIEKGKKENKKTVERMMKMHEEMRESNRKIEEKARMEMKITAERIKKVSELLGFKDLKLNNYEVGLGVRLIDLKMINVEWQDIGGLDNLVNDIKLNINSSTNSAHGFPKGILFYGPPGCGKTMLAAAIAKSAGIRFLNIRVSDIYDKEVGEPQKNTEAIFSLAKKIQPTIIFIDEIDSFLKKRFSEDTEVTSMVKNLFLSLWDGIDSKVGGNKNKVIVMGTTNKLRDLDEAVLRRLSLQYEVPLPDLRNREKIIKTLLKKDKLCDNIEWEKLSQETEGWSGSDLANLRQEAIVNAAKGTESGKDMRKLTMNDLLVGLENIQISKTNMRIEQNYETREQKEKAREVARSIGIPNLNLNKHELKMTSHLLDQSELKTQLSDIGGLNKVKEDIRKNVIEPLKNCPKFLPQGVLFYGSPGCGKTMLAAAIAKSAGVRLLIYKVSEIKNAEYGETEKMIAAMFSLAKKVQPAIVFIDEIDSILRNRSMSDNETTAAMKNQFLSLWDGVLSKENEQEKIIIMGATNRPKDIDQAILRRLSLRIHVTLPNREERMDIWKILLKNYKVSDDLDWDFLLSKTEGWSGSDIRDVCKEAMLNVQYSSFAEGCSAESTEAANSVRPLQMEDFEVGIKRIDEFLFFRNL